ncbi:hypothetical protein GOP47_0004568 [Adiantum capillus-veneris]|uniref:Photolyase/cryptochrome alpha/beta domain-containing protein n=1 Tax=Adiantum capillus-veneris TaxID=13818 RepID=A0A9D4ZQG0_ADICA|nr:hypothetical protein GOP47_0004568 [Adiantum capillus-veneris]
MFSRVEEWDAFSWSILMSAYVQHDLRKMEIPLHHQSYKKTSSIVLGIVQEGFHYDVSVEHSEQGFHFGYKWVPSVASLQGRMNLCSHIGRGRQKTRRQCYRVLAVLADASIEALSENKEVSILWFKKDLRLDDHVGLSLAAAYEALLPVYIFDRYLLCGWSLEMLEELVAAVAELKLVLQGVGSDLIIRHGSVKAELTASEGEVSATSIIVKEEMEREWQEAVFFYCG